MRVFIGGLVLVATAIAIYRSNIRFLRYPLFCPLCNRRPESETRQNWCRSMRSEGDSL